METVGGRRSVPPHASVREEPAEYLIKLDVSGFVEDELTVETAGSRITVRCDQLETEEDDGKAFRLHERLEESFRLPDDADAEHARAVYKHGTLEIHARRRQPMRRLVPIERDHLVDPTPKGC
jgi:HSP20 family molecular chaperone IbpA